MTQTALVVATLLAGMVLGFAAAWLMLRKRGQGEYERGRLGGSAEREVLAERLANLERTYQESKTAVAEAAAEGTKLHEEITRLNASCAALAEKNNRIPALESGLKEKEALVDRLSSEMTALKQALSEARTRLEEEQKAAVEKMALLEDARKNLSDAFKALSSDALKSNNQSFLELARTTLERYQEGAKGDLEKRHQAIEQLVQPVRESLTKFDGKIADLEKAREGAYQSLLAQVRTLGESQAQLRTEASNLVKALGTPRVRGRWGEIQLRRVVEMAGMLDHCDFFEQQNVNTQVKLPGEKNIVVDAKTPLAAYLEAIETEDEGLQKEKLQDHARQVRDHMKALSAKSYWDQFEPAPEFVVLFLPGETFFSAALEQDPSLIEQGVEQQVILATPTTLISLLKAVAYGWRQESMAANARQISELGKELYKRVSDMSGHLAELGGRLGKAVESYNKAIGALETRVMVSARRFKELGASTAADIEEIQPIETSARRIQLPGETGD
jgi:DNA recombination protein RmuC